MVDLQKAREVAIKAATEAGGWLKDNQTDIKITKQKDIEDIQLQADLNAEKLIIEKISQDFPDHNIFSEEAGLIDHHSDYTWVVDPLDGTKEYLRGQKDFLTLVGLQDKKEVLAGCVYNPNTNETFSGAKALGATRNDQSLKVSTKAELKNSIITMKLPNFGATKEWQEKVVKVLGNLLPVCYRVRSSTCDAANICLGALGAVEAFILMGGLRSALVRPNAGLGNCPGSRSNHYQYFG